MSRTWSRGLLTRAALLVLLRPPVFTGSPTTFFSSRFRGPTIQVRDVEGIESQVHDGKLHLRIKEFLTLVLKNNTQINLMRLDVLNSADAILSAKAPFDPNI